MAVGNRGGGAGRDEKGVVRGQREEEGGPLVFFVRAFCPHQRCSSTVALTTSEVLIDRRRVDVV